MGGLQFKRDQYIDWCQFAVKAVTLGIRLLMLTLAVHFSMPQSGGFKCHECEGVNTFFVVGASGNSNVRIRCRACGRERDLLSEVAQAYGLGTDE